MRGRGCPGVADGAVLRARGALTERALPLNSALQSRMRGRGTETVAQARGKNEGQMDTHLRARAKLA
jgi:hypothetical protein